MAMVDLSDMQTHPATSSRASSGQSMATAMIDWSVRLRHASSSPPPICSCTRWGQRVATAMIMIDSSVRFWQPFELMRVGCVNRVPAVGPTKATTFSSVTASTTTTPSVRIVVGAPILLRPRGPQLKGKRG